MSDSRASFRGVPFSVTTAEMESGRRTAQHVFPGKDDPYIEDLGRKPRRFSVDAVLVGADYRAQKDSLLEALEKHGPGKLAHPYYGELEVQVDGFTIRESWEAGRTCTISIQFYQTGRVTYPVTATNLAGSVGVKSADLDSAVQAAAGKIKTSSSFNVDTLTTAMQEGINAIDKEVSKVYATYDQVNSGIDKFTRDLSRMSSQINSLVSKPASMILRTQEVLRQFAGIATVLDCVKTYKRLINSLVATFSTRKYQNSANGAEAAENDRIMLQSFKAAAAAAASDNLAVGDFESRQQAQELLQEVKAILEDVKNDPTSDDVFLAALDLRSALVAAVPPEGQTLKDVRKVVLNQTLPAVVAAHQIYGDYTKCDELTTRNRIENPAAVIGGREYEVIT